MHEKQWGEWVRQHLAQRNWTAADAARATGISASIISRWISHQAEPGLENLRKFADTLKLPILEVLVAAGYISEKEAGTPPPPPDPSAKDLPTTELLRELNVRLLAHEAASGGAEGLPVEVNIPGLPTVRINVAEELPEEVRARRERHRRATEPS